MVWEERAGREGTGGAEATARATGSVPAAARALRRSSGNANGTSHAWCAGADADGADGADEREGTNAASASVVPESDATCAGDARGEGCLFPPRFHEKVRHAALSPPPGPREDAGVAVLARKRRQDTMASAAQTTRVAKSTKTNLYPPGCHAGSDVGVAATGAGATTTALDAGQSAAANEALAKPSNMQAAGAGSAEWGEDDMAAAPPPPTESENVYAAEAIPAHASSFANTCTDTMSADTRELMSEPDAPHATHAPDSMSRSSGMPGSAPTPAPAPAPMPTHADLRIKTFRGRTRHRGTGGAPAQPEAGPPPALAVALVSCAPTNCVHAASRNENVSEAWPEAAHATRRYTVALCAAKHEPSAG